MTATHRRLVLFVLTALFFGGTFVTAKADFDYLSPLLFVALRFDIAVVPLVGYVVATHSRTELFPRSVHDVVGILATGVFVIGLANALLFVGQEHVSSGVGSIIFSLNPILTPVFAMTLLADERLSTRGMLGMLIGLLGVGLVVDVDPANLLDGEVLRKSVVFLGAVNGALGTVLIRWVDTSLSSTVRTAWAFLVSAALTHGMSVASGESLVAATWSPMALVALAYVGVFADTVAYLTYFGFLDDVGPIRGNLVFYAVPIVVMLGGTALLGESISTLTVVGFATVFTGPAVLTTESLRGTVVRVYDGPGPHMTGLAGGAAPGCDWVTGRSLAERR